MYLSAALVALPDMRTFASRRSTEQQVSAAVTLGWRIAKLYSLDAGELPSSPPDNLLPMRRSLPAAQRLALELRAAAGEAQRVGAQLDPGELSDLLALAEQASGGGGEAAFRDRIRTWHIDLATVLWARDETTGKAYELGSFLSDTWNRVVLELRRPGAQRACVVGELRCVFAPERVERIMRLLDDLQARIDPAAVRIVKQHLAGWQAAVQAREPAHATRAGLEALHSQSVIWCQLVTGNKEPEAFIDHDDRARVRDTMAARMLRSYRRCWKAILAVAVAMAALAYAALELGPGLDMTQYGPVVAFAGSLAGALGLSVTSIGLTVRKSLDARAELLWNTALVEVISAKTLLVEALMQAPQPRRSRLAAGIHVRRPQAESVALLQADRVA